MYQSNIHRHTIHYLMSNIHIPVFNRFLCLEEQLPSFVKKYTSKNTTLILDYALEHQQSFSEKVCKKYTEQLQTYPQCFHAIKCSTFGQPQDWERNIFRVLDTQINKTQIQKKGKYLIDAENVEIQQSIEDLTGACIHAYNKETPQIFKTYQMYRRDSLETLKYDLQYYEKQNLYHGVKLVRGAYLKQDMSSGVLFSTKKETDDCYNRALEMLLDHKMQYGNIEYILATHNTKSIDLHSNLLYEKYKIDIDGGRDRDRDVENRNTPLYSNGEQIQIQKQKQKPPFIFYTASLLGFTPKYKTHKHLIYLPYGNITDTLPYLIRRLYENYEILKWLF